MPNWYINCVAAQILFNEHGFISPLRDKGYILQGKFWVDFEYEEAPLIRAHPRDTRQPRFHLGLDDMLAMHILPSKESRLEYAKAMMLERIGAEWEPTAP